MRFLSQAGIVPSVSSISSNLECRDLLHTTPSKDQPETLTLCSTYLEQLCKHLQDMETTVSHSEVEKNHNIPLNTNIQ